MASVVLDSVKEDEVEAMVVVVATPIASSKKKMNDFLQRKESQWQLPHPLVKRDPPRRQLRQEPIKGPGNQAKLPPISSWKWVRPSCRGHAGIKWNYRCSITGTGVIDLDGSLFPIFISDSHMVRSFERIKVEDTNSSATAIPTLTSNTTSVTGLKAPIMGTEHQKCRCLSPSWIFMRSIQIQSGPWTGDKTRCDILDGALVKQQGNTLKKKVALKKGKSYRKGDFWVCFQKKTKNLPRCRKTREMRNLPSPTKKWMQTRNVKLKEPLLWKWRWKRRRKKRKMMILSCSMKLQCFKSCGETEWANIRHWKMVALTHKHHWLHSGVMGIWLPGLFHLKRILAREI